MFNLSLDSFCSSLLTTGFFCSFESQKQVYVNVDKAPVLVEGLPVGKKPVAAKAAQKKVFVLQLSE